MTHTLVVIMTALMVVTTMVTIQAIMMAIMVVIMMDTMVNTGMDGMKAEATQAPQVVQVQRLTHLQLT